MAHYVAQGSISMWLIVLAGMALCLVALRFSRRPSVNQFAVLGTLMVATITTTLHGALMDMGAWLDAPERGITSNLASTVKLGAISNLPALGLGGAFFCVSLLLVGIGAFRLSCLIHLPFRSPNRLS